MLNKLAILGGQKAITKDPEDMFLWPIVTDEDEKAVLQVIRDRAMSGTEITKTFEKEFSIWQGSKYTLGCNNGTAALQLAMYGCGVGRGDEIICPSVTYWATCLQVFSLGGTIVFADIDSNTLCINPDDIEHRITKKTKAIVVVHYLGYPCDMDRIMEIAKKYNIKVIEDVSHAQGGYYKGKKVGSIGNVGAMSLMSGKSFAIGEAGMLVTDDVEIYERAVSFGHYSRYNGFETEYLKEFEGLPLGGFKYRMHQASAAMGRVQLKYYDQRMAEINKAMNYFWDGLEGTCGIRAIRPKKGSGSTMAGWYVSAGRYYPEKLKGLSVTRFCNALKAEGVNTSPGCNKPLHTHAMLHNADIYNDGKPTRIANSTYDLREGDKSLPVSENIATIVFKAPWFKHFRPQIIDEYIDAYKKVCNNYKELLDGDEGNSKNLGGWNFFNSAH